MLRLFIAPSSCLFALMVCCSLLALFSLLCRIGTSLSMALMWRIFDRCAARSSSGTLSSRLSIEALAFIGAESMACVCPLTMPFSMHICNTLVKTSSNMDSGKSWRVRLIVECQGISSSKSYPMKNRISKRILQCWMSFLSLMMFSR